MMAVFVLQRREGLTRATSRGAQMPAWPVPTRAAFVLWRLWGFFAKIARDILDAESAALMQAVGASVITPGLAASMRFGLAWHASLGRRPGPGGHRARVQVARPSCPSRHPEPAGAPAGSDALDRRRQ